MKIFKLSDTRVKIASLIGLWFLLNFNAEPMAVAEWVPTQTLEVELQNWVQVDLINRGQWIAVTTTRPTSEDLSRKQASDEFENSELADQSISDPLEQHSSKSDKE